MTAPSKKERRPRYHRSEDPLVTEPSKVWEWPWSWRNIREYMGSKYAGHYTAAELRAMEVKWRRIFAEAGWSVKGQ